MANLFHGRDSTKNQIKLLANALLCLKKYNIPTEYLVDKESFDSTKQSIPRHVLKESIEDL